MTPLAAEKGRAAPAGWGWVVWLGLASRLAYSVFAYFVLAGGEPVSAWAGHPIFETHRLTAPDWGPAWRLLVNAWFRWDTGWYLKIAALGYAPDDGSIIFPPLYPLAIRALAPLAGGNYLLAALIVSNVCALAALALFYAVARQELRSAPQAAAAVVLMAVFPAGFYLYAAYSEALFLALALAAWLMAVRGRWGWAGILGALAALARLQGWLLVLPFAWLMFVGEAPGEAPLAEARRALAAVRSGAAWRQFWARLRAGGWAALALPVAAFAGFTLWLEWAGFGAVSRAYDVYWNMQVVMPWQGAALFVQRLAQGGLLFGDWVDVGLFAATLALAVLGLARVRPALSLFVWATLGIIMMRGYSAHLLAGFMRYALTLFPIFLVLSAAHRWRWLFFPLIITSLLLQFLLLWIFLQWGWVA
jgi:hypothetical protein